MSGRALVVGVTGISGGNLAQRLLADGWEVAGLCRRPDGLDERITPLAADLEDAEAVAAAVRGTAPTHVFFTTWSRRATEAENCDVNGRMLQNLLDATARREVGAARRARHRAEALPRPVRGLRARPSRTRRSPRIRPACRTRTSTTSRRTSSSPPPSATGSRGPCTGRTR